MILRKLRFSHLKFSNTAFSGFHKKFSACSLVDCLKLLLICLIFYLLFQLYVLVYICPSLVVDYKPLESRNNVSLILVFSSKISPVRLSACLSICLSVRPPGQPSVYVSLSLSHAHTHRNWNFQFNPFLTSLKLWEICLIYISCPDLGKTEYLLLQAKKSMHQFLQNAILVCNLVGD